MGGYIASAEKWVGFSKEWESHLNEHSLEEFKLSRMPFSAPEHVASFYRIIERHKIPLSFDCVIDLGMWDMIVGEFELPPQADFLKKMLQNPYYLASKMLMKYLFVMGNKIGLEEPLDLIFDEQIGTKTVLLGAWNTFRESLPDDAKKNVGATPVFRDSKKFMPLQAADLIAGYVQRAVTLNKDGNNDLFPFTVSQDTKMKRFVIRFTEEQLREEFNWICSRENIEKTIKSLKLDPIGV